MFKNHKALYKQFQAKNHVIHKNNNTININNKIIP